MAETRRSIPALYIGIVMFALGLLVATLLHSGAGGEAGNGETMQEDSVAFILDEEPVLESELAYAYSSELHQLAAKAQEHRIGILKLAAFDHHLITQSGGDAEKVEQMKRELLQAAPPSESDIQAFYDQNRERINQPLDSVRDIIANALQQERSRNVRAELIEQLEKEGRLRFPELEQDAPQAQFNLDGAPFLGQPDAPVTVVEFADYQCGHCQTASQTLQKLQEDTEGAFRWVMLDFPVLGELSRQLAIGAFCAAKQERYWDYHHALFKQQDALTKESPLMLAQELSLDEDAFNACVSAEEAEAFVAQSEQQALTLGLRGTPGIFINGRPFEGGNLTGDLESAVEKAIAAKAP